MNNIKAILFVISLLLFTMMKRIILVLIIKVAVLILFTSLISYILELCLLYISQNHQLDSRDNL